MIIISTCKRWAACPPRCNCVAARMGSATANSTLNKYVAPETTIASLSG